jgi:predicted aldo/keto reductase-like oxidoreductase
MSDAIPKRPLGKTGVMVSSLALGGHHIGDPPNVDDAIDLMHKAIDAGLTYFDNCWEYHNGESEVRMGRALQGGRREKVFLATKVCTHGRDASLGLEMLEQSLRRLGTDHVDLWQIHGVTFENDPELAFRKGGVIEALERAKKSGKARFVGFTGHKDPAIHLKMLSYKFPFDTCQFPLNCFDASFRSFEKDVLPECQRQGIAVLGMKPMSGRAEPIKKGIVTAEEMLRYAMSLPVATTITGIDNTKVLEQDLAVARGFQPLAAQQMSALRDKARTLAKDGRFEIYKTSIAYDNPEARRAHGFPIDAKQKEIKEEIADAAKK